MAIVKRRAKCWLCGMLGDVECGDLSPLFRFLVRESADKSAHSKLFAQVGFFNTRVVGEFF